ncbi:MAG: IMP dehydrogenase [Candidatus Roizmanbacteria bacterium]|nr:IMP dehydrogenase [Candidatus Roizmanbacteria bacterium]
MVESSPVPTYIRLAEELNAQANRTFLPEGLSYDDVKILPQRSVVNSPSEVSVRTHLADGIDLNIPIISANMASVTEVEMAVLMALQGGIGALHRELTIPKQVEMIQEIKGRHQYVIDNPPILHPGDTVGSARRLMAEHERGYVVLLDDENKLHGIVTTRDLRPDFVTNDQQLSNEIARTHEQGLITAPKDISIDEAKRLMHRNRVEKLILVDGEGNVGGVITDRDIREIERYPNATKDRNGKLQVLASVGIGTDALDRALASEEAGADGIIVDILHGDCRKATELITSLASKLHIPIVGGNGGTGDETDDLLNAGAHVAKIGYGPGSFCTTQIITGTGASQFTAVIKAAAVAFRHNKAIIADGGIRAGGDIAKAIAGGAAAVMLGGILVGVDESPGIVYRDESGRLYKIGRGSASATANQNFAKATGAVAKRRTPQGVDAVKIGYKGPGEELLFELMDGLKHGIANSGGNDLKSFRNKVKFERQSPASYAEGRPHINGQ